MFVGRSVSLIRYVVGSARHGDIDQIRLSVV